jgi:hypothetical protein
MGCHYSSKCAPGGTACLEGSGRDISTIHFYRDADHKKWNNKIDFELK